LKPEEEEWYRACMYKREQKNGILDTGSGIKEMKNEGGSMMAEREGNGGKAERKERKGTK
jgi:hypothetical protein